MQDRGLTELTYEEELEKIEAEAADLLDLPGSTAPDGPEPDEE